ncbi:hypothetical protein EBR21_13775 [bacterium]|nr:hypothetical protein [bacterium]
MKVDQTNFSKMTIGGRHPAAKFLQESGRASHFVETPAMTRSSDLHFRARDDEQMNARVSGKAPQNDIHSISE